MAEWMLLMWMIRICGNNLLFEPGAASLQWLRPFQLGAPISTISRSPERGGNYGTPILIIRHFRRTNTPSNVYSEVNESPAGCGPESESESTQLVKFCWQFGHLTCKAGQKCRPGIPPRDFQDSANCTPQQGEGGAF